MKRILCILLTVIITLSFLGCSANGIKAKDLTVKNSIKKILSEQEIADVESILAAGISFYNKYSGTDSFPVEDEDLMLITERTITLQEKINSENDKKYNDALLEAQSIGFCISFFAINNSFASEQDLLIAMSEQDWKDLKDTVNDSVKFFCK